jgi:hypothetical protein
MPLGIGRSARTVRAKRKKRGIMNSTQSGQASTSSILRPLATNVQASKGVKARRKRRRR